MNKDMSRLGLFVFFDPHGIVDDYVIHLLQYFRPNFTKLVIISNGPLDKAAQKKLTAYADSLFIRDNQGLDAAAYKAGLISFCGWEEVEKYDEVVLMNDTFFGPIHSFGDMFDEMSGRDLDFWGMSAGYHQHVGWHKVKYGYIPDHIQTFFVAFRKNMVCSEAFHTYWNNYDDTLNDFISVVSQHEVIMTKHFQDLGFCWGIYANTAQYRSEHPAENFNLYHYHAHTMMQDMKFPVFKKKTLNLNIPDQLNKQDLECSADALNYIQTETDYDAKLIWDNALRLYNVTDLYYSLHLNYVLPSIPVDLPITGKAALVYRISNPLFTEPILKRASQIASVLDVYILPEDQSVRQHIAKCPKRHERITILEPSNQKTEMGGFVLCCKELAMLYDYLGYVHDASNPEHYPATTIESTVYGSLQNISNDPAYITQILNCFESNPRLGLLGAPFPIHHHNFSNYADGWAGCFTGSKKLAKQLGLNCNLDKEKHPFFITGNFWCRTDAIRDIWNYDWNRNQFQMNTITNSCHLNDVLKRILPFAAQSRQYYSGIVMHVNYASMRISGQQYMLTHMINVTQNQLGCKSPRYKGYMEQLEAIHRNDHESPLMIDLSHFSMVKIIQIYLDQHMPPWFTQFANRLYNALRTAVLKRKAK